MLAVLVRAIGSVCIALGRRALADGRFWIVAPPALTAGLGLTALALLWFGRSIPYLAIIAGLAALLGALWVGARRIATGPATPWSWSLDAHATLALAALGLLSATGASALWSASIWGGISHENLFQHTGLVSMLIKEPKELRHPLEPDHPLSYRLAYHYVAAAAARIGGLHAATALAGLTAMGAALGALTMCSAVARHTSVTGGLLAGAAYAAGGSITWISGTLPPAGDGSALDRLVTTLERLPGGLTHPGPVGQLAAVNGSLVFGYMLAPVALWAYVEAFQASGRRALALAATAALLLGTLAAAAESLFAVVAATALADVLRRLAGLGASRRPEARPLIVFGALLAPIVAGASGLLAVESSAGEVRGRLGVAFSGAQTLQAPTAALANLPQTTITERLASGDGWTPMWSLAFLLDVGFTPILALAAFGWLARRGHVLGALLALTALASFGLTALVTLRTYPWDMFRFTQSGMAFGYAAAAVAATDAATSLPAGSRRRIARALAAGLVGVAACGFVASAFVWPELATRREGRDYALDLLLVPRLVAQSETTPRVLVAPGALDWFDLHSSGDANVTKYVTALGASVPMGHDWYGHDQAYASRYEAAHQTLDYARLADLAISHLYILPERLNPQQLDGLSTLVGGGTATLIDLAGDGPLRREVYRLDLNRERPRHVP